MTPKTVLHFILSCVLALITTCVLAEQFNVPQVEAIVDRASTDLLTGNHKAFMQAWADKPDIVMIDPIAYRVISGRQAIQAHFKKEFELSQLLNFKLLNSEILSMPDPNQAWVKLEIKMELREANEKHITRQVTGLYLLVKTNGDWQIKQLISPFTTFKLR